MAVTPEVRARADAREADARQAASQDDLLSLIGYHLKRSYVHILRDFRETLGDMNLTPRTFSVLSVVVANPDISQSDVAASLAIERSGTVVIVDELEGRDLIQRNRDPQDRRVYALRVTLKGRAFYDKALLAVRAHEDRLLAGFDASERETLIALLGRLHKGEGA